MIPLNPTDKAKTGLFAGMSEEDKNMKFQGDPMNIIDSAMGLASTAAPMIKNINKDSQDRMDDRGRVTHKVNTLGNITSMASAGAKAGMMFGPLGGAIGTGVGALAGGVMSILDNKNQPTLSEMITENNNFNMGQHVKGIASNDTFNQQVQAAEDGLNQVNDTKQIEVEKDEVILRKVGKVYKKVADFKGGKSHAQGGEDYVAEEGDVIFPGKKRTAVLSALRTRNWKRLESMRSQLPPDTVAPQKADGVMSVDPTNPKKKTYNAPQGGTNTFPAIHIPTHENPETQADYQAAYAKRMGLSTDQVTGFLDQRTSDQEYKQTSQAYLEGTMKDWRNTPTNRNFSQVSPEYKDAMSSFQNTWYKDNPRQVNETVHNYYKKGPANKPNTYAEGTSGIKTDSNATSGIELNDEPIRVQNYIYNKLIDAGLNENAAKGVIVNLTYETGGFKSIEEKGTNVHGTKGLGLAQWTDSPDAKRRTAFEEFLKETDSVATDVDANIEFLISELKGEQDYNVGTNIKKLNAASDTVESASKHVLTKYERPADQSDSHNAKRIERSKDFLAQEEIPTPAGDGTGDGTVLKNTNSTSEPEPKLNKFTGLPEVESNVKEANTGMPAGSGVLTLEAQEANEEDDSGYWSASSPTGRKALKELGKRMKSAEAKDNISSSGSAKDKSWLDYGMEALSKYAQGSVGGGALGGISPGGMMGHNAVGEAVSEVFGVNRVTGDGPAQISGFKDNDQGKLLEQEAKDFYNYLQHGSGKGDITWLPGDFFRKWDATRAKLYGTKDTTSPKIADALAGATPEELEEIVADAKAKGIISNLGSTYIWDTAVNPEDFRSLQFKAGEQIDIAAGVGNLPSLVKTGAKAAKGLYTGASLTKKGVSAFLKGRKLKLLTKGAKSDPKVANKLKTALNEFSQTSSKYTGKESLDDIVKASEDLQKELGAEWVKMQVPSWDAVTSTAKRLKNNIAKYPDKVREAIMGTSFTDIAQTQKDLERITGKTAAELKDITKAELGTIYKKGLDDRMQAIEDVTKRKEDAWRKYTNTQKYLKDIEKRQKLAAKNAPSDEALLALAEDTEKAKETAANAFNDLRTINAEEKSAYAEIDRLENFMSDPEYMDKFRVVSKLNDGVANQMAKLDDADEAKQLFQADFKAANEALGSLNSSLARGTKASDKLADLTASVTGAKKGLKSDKEALVEASGLTPKKDLKDWKKNFKDAPRLAKVLGDDAELLKQYKRGSLSGARLYNAIRDKYPDIDIEDEAVVSDITPSSEDTTEVTPERGPVESVIVGGVGKGGAEGVGDAGVLGAEDIDTEIKPIDPNLKVGDKKDGIGTKLAGGFGALADYAPAIYNIVKGLEEPEKVNRRFVTPQTMKYQNLSQPQLNLIDDAFTASIGNARNMSGGLMSNFRANTEASWADKIARTAQVNAQEAGRSDQIANQNVAIRNQADQINTQTHQRADVMDMQSQAATDSFLAQGMQDVANIGAVHRRDKSANNNQNMVLKMLGEGRPFEVGEDGSMKFKG